MTEVGFSVPERAEGDRPLVIYIAGSGRSGSTLLERALGAIPGFVNVGELIDVLRRTQASDERCGCGEAFSACAFWTGVGKRGFGGWDMPTARELGSLQAEFARQRRIPAMMLRSGRGGFGRRLERYQELYAGWYRAILDEAGGRVVVDASKWPAQALALASERIDLRVVHLVRDPRGVAYSMSKQGVQRPQAADGQAMVSSGSATATVRWTATQTEVDLLRRRGARVTRVRYEDLVQQPRETIEGLLSELGVDIEAGSLDHVEDGRIVLPSSHGVSGNPSRFVEGPVDLRLDEEWKQQLSPARRSVLTALALPQLLASGYLGSGSSGRQQPAGDGGSTPADDDHPVETPLLSVVLPTRGRPELVRASIAAVVAQDYAGPMEILIVHDQEELDPTLEHLGRPGREVTVMSNVHSPGLAGARNSGLDVVRGEFVATCDDDDVWHPDKVRKQLALLGRDPDLLVVGSGIRLLFPNDRIVEWPGRSARIELSTLVLNRVKELHSSTLMMRRDAFAKAGRYDEDLPFGYAEDYDWVLRAAKVGHVGVVIEPLADIRKDVQSWFRERAENTANALRHLLATHPELRASRRGSARILGQIAYAEACLGRRGDSLRTVGSALLRWPFAPHAYLALTQATVGLDPRVTLKAARVFRRGLS